MIDLLKACINLFWAVACLIAGIIGLAIAAASLVLTLAAGGAVILVMVIIVVFGLATLGLI